MNSHALGVAGAGALTLDRRWRRLRTKVIYWWRHGRWPALDAPTRFTEWVQWRKLHDQRASLSMLTDKAYAKAHVTALVGAGLAVPTLWEGGVLPAQPVAPLPLVVKANHGCNQYRVCTTQAEWSAACVASRRWMRSSYGSWLDEHHYRAARRAILVEPFLGGAGAPVPEDFKVYVFGGQAALIQHHRGRGGDHRWTQFDREWRMVGGAPSDQKAPATLAIMLERAEALAAGHDFLRVDFYEVDGRLWFGEYCLFPGSGLDPFTPDALDLALGALWSRERPLA